MAEMNDEGGVHNLMADGPMVDGWEVWHVEGGGELWWLLVRPGEDVRDAMRASGAWDGEEYIDDDAEGARRWTLRESISATVGVEDHKIRMPLHEAAAYQARSAARHDHCRVIATTCW